MFSNDRVTVKARMIIEKWHWKSCEVNAEGCVPASEIIHTDQQCQQSCGPRFDLSLEQY